jgi:hypothetical protein
LGRNRLALPKLLAKLLAKFLVWLAVHDQ